MKTIFQRILVFSTLILLPYYGFSQSGYTRATTMDVNGIFIGGTYTKAQVEAAWGTPTTYRSNLSEFGVNETYIYADPQPNSELKNTFRFSDNGIFESYTIETPDFAVYTAFDGGIRVGDTLSRVITIGLGTPVLQSDGTYRVPSGDNRFIFRHQNGVITTIIFISPI